MDRATQIAATIQDPDPKGWALTGIAGAYAEAGRFDDAMQIAERLKNSPYNSQALTAIVNGATRAGRLDQALQVAQTGFATDEFLDAVVEHYGNGDDSIGTVLDFANTIKDPTTRFAVIERAVPRLVSAGRLDQALQIARSIDEAARKISALVEICSQYIKNKQFDRATEVLHEALQLAKTGGDPSAASQHFLRIYQMYTDAKQIDKASAVLAEAQTITDTIQDPNTKSWQLADIGAHYAQAGRFDQANQIAATIDNPYGKASALKGIAAAYAHAGQMDKAIEVLSQAMQTIKTVTAGKDYTAPRDSAENTLRDMATALAFNNQFALALYACQSLESISDKVDILGDIGAKYAKSGQKLDSTARKILHDIIAEND